MSETSKAHVDGDGPSLSEWIDTVLQHGKAVLAIFLVTLTAGIAYAFLAPPTYRSEALIQVEDKKPSALSGVQSLADALGAAASPVTGEIEILRSRGVIINALQATGSFIKVSQSSGIPWIGKWLSTPQPKGEQPQAGAGGNAAQMKVLELTVPDSYLDHKLSVNVIADGAYELQDEDGAALGKGQSTTPLRFTLDGQPASMTLALQAGMKGAHFEVTRLAPVTAYRDVLKNLLVAESGRESKIIRVIYENRDEAYARSLVNAIALAYIAQDVARRSAEAEQRLEFLTKQLPEIKRNVERSENALNEFRTRTGTIDVDKSVAALLQRSVEIEKSRIELNLQRDELLQRFTPSHPAIKAIDSQLLQTNQEAKRILAMINQVPEGQRDLLRLQRDVSVSTELYITLLDTVQQLKVARAGTVGNVRIIDLAIRDSEPVAPRKALVILAAALVGGLLGIGAAMMARNLRPTLRDIDQLEGDTGIPSYASIPESSAQQRLNQATGAKGMKVLALQHPHDPAVESLRTMRIGLAFAQVNAPDRSIIITGPTPNVGKSFISVNLACVLAASGKRVLLVEADLRRPQISGYFGMPRNLAGLADLLIGEATVAQATHTIDVQAGALHIMPSGTLPPNPGELLSSDTFAQLLVRVQDDYDHVVIDTPPILPVGDTLAIMMHVSTTFLVVRAEQNTPDEVRTAIKRIHNAGFAVKGLIFNGVKHRRMRYGMAYQYKYYESETLR
ncbi:polysaccharide biosynthesis tyrosine autokinase [Achromobacter aegrifaciens]